MAYKIKNNWLLKTVSSLLCNMQDDEMISLYKLSILSDITYSHSSKMMLLFLEEKLVRRPKGKGLLITAKGKKVRDSLLNIREILENKNNRV